VVPRDVAKKLIEDAIDRLYGRKSPQTVASDKAVLASAVSQLNKFKYLMICATVQGSQFRTKIGYSAQLGPASSSTRRAGPSPKFKYPASWAKVKYPASWAKFKYPASWAKFKYPAGWAKFRTKLKYPASWAKFKYPAGWAKFRTKFKYPASWAKFKYPACWAKFKYPAS